MNVSQNCFFDVSRDYSQYFVVNVSRETRNDVFSLIWMHKLKNVSRET